MNPDLGDNKAMLNPGALIDSIICLFFKSEYM